MVAYVVVDTAKVDIFKQITTAKDAGLQYGQVVVDTAKVDIFKQITTSAHHHYASIRLLLIPQR